MNEARSSEIPDFLSPMLAGRTDHPFDSPEHLFEAKWDGIRALGYVREGSTLLRSRNQKDITPQFPELSRLHEQPGLKGSVLDGEIVVLNQDRPSFYLAQKRIRSTSRATISHLSKRHPAVYIVFDILFASGRDIRPEPLAKRKQTLISLVPGSAGPAVAESGIKTRGKQLYKAACERGFEGIVAKRLDSPYLCGRHTTYWLKIRRILSAECAVCGFVPFAPDKEMVGSLVLGAYFPSEGADRLTYVGNVGTGFTESDRADLARILRKSQAQNPPLTGVPGTIAKTAIWCVPELVCEVNYLELTPDGRLRHPSFKGIRSDKGVKDCVFNDHRD